MKLQQTQLSTRNNHELRISRCLIHWSLKNVRHGMNDSFVIDPTGANTVIQIPEGYYTFKDLKTFLASHKITIGSLKNNKVKLTSEKNLDLRYFGNLLGFEHHKTITKDQEYTSLTQANLTNGLDNIHIHCNLVDSLRNYSYYGSTDLYYPSTQLVTLSIDTLQPLNGNVTQFGLDFLRLPCRVFTGQDIVFDVISGGDVNDYEIYLTLEIL